MKIRNINILALLGVFLVFGCSNGSPSGTDASIDSSSIESSEDSYTLDMVVSDIDLLLSEIDEGLVWDEENDCYSLATILFMTNDESEESLSFAYYILTSFIPRYLKEVTAFYGDPNDPSYIDLFDEDFPYYYGYFETPDENIGVHVYTFVGLYDEDFYVYGCIDVHD